MNGHQDEIREQQRASWNAFSAGWKKWDDLTMEFLRPYGDKIVASIAPTGADVVLDIASGTGEPGLTIAQMLSTGHVMLSDLSEDMLSIAQENAARRGIGNVKATVADVTELPFDDNTFDAVSCRFGFMFFPDMDQAAREMVRVLKPGGRIATSVWNVPEKNFWVTAIMGTIAKHMELAPPPPGSPGMFRCAADGMIAKMFEQAGLGNVQQEEIQGTLNVGSAEVYWTMMYEVAAPVVAALSNADEATIERVRTDVYRSIEERYPDGNVRIASSALVISGRK